MKMPPPYRSQHLFQSCSSHNWDVVAECYRDVASILNDEMTKPRDKTNLRLNMKYLLKYKDEWGNTPLLIACYNRAPSDVIGNILKLADMAGLGTETNVKGEMLSHETITSQVANDGSTALLIACAINMPLISIKQLLCYHYRKLGATSTKQLLSVNDSTGSIPLSYLLGAEYGSMQSIQKLELLKKINFLVSVYKHSSPLVSNTSIDESYVHNPAFYYTTVLKSLISFPLACPSRGWMKRIANGLTTEIQRLEDEKSDGRDIALNQVRTALHHAINTSYADICVSVRGPNDYNDVVKNGVNNQNVVIYFLLQIYPDAATGKMMIPANRQGTLLSHALLNGLWWDGDPRGKLCNYINGPVRSLCDAEPGLVTKQDEATGLYPFMLAATIRDFNPLKSDREEIEEKPDYNLEKKVAAVGTHRLSTIYGLLRRTPNLVNC